MITKIKGEQPFQVLATNFSISPSNEDYTLQISADGENYSDLFTVSAGQTKMCTGMANGSFYRLKNNESDVEVNWRTQCNDGGSGGGGGSQYILPPATKTVLGGIKVGEGLAITNDGTLSTSGGSIDSGAVQTQIDNSINAFSQELQGGEPIVGMAAQLYSTDGVKSEDWYNYRTTAGDADVNTGDAELRKIEGNATYPEAAYGASAALESGGEPVEGFTYNITTGDVGNAEWIVVSKDENVTSYDSKVARIATIPNNVEGFWHYVDSNNYDVAVWWKNLEWNVNKNCTKIDDYHYEFNNGNGTIVIENGYVTATITEGNSVWKQIKVDYANSYIPQNGYQILTGETAENDLTFGTTVYTYENGDWSPSLPQAISNLEVNSEAYTPSEGDEITIVEYLSAEGDVSYQKPTTFIALGLNSFDYTCEGVLTTKEESCKIYYSNDEEDPTRWGGGVSEEFSDYTTYFVKAVTGLGDGYVIHSPNGVLQFGVGLSPADNYEEAISGDNDFDYSGMVKIENNKTYVVYPTTAMPYIVFCVENGDETDVCVHPRWSGKMDEGFEEYRESMIDLSNLVDDCPLLSIGEVRNTIDLQNKKFVERISIEPYSQEAVEALVEDGKVLGTDFNIDENYIYVVNDEPQEDDIEVDNVYDDNDFSVEYFVDENGIIEETVYAENYYITNLVDKLRRMENVFVHLDSPDTAGEAGKTYEYQGRIMKWVEGSGYTAEWLKVINSTDANEGTGFIYSIIPNGTTLFEFRYSSSGQWRKVVYDNNKLYLKETGGTVVCAVTIGNTFEFPTQYSNSYKVYGIFENGYIGFRKGHSNINFQNIWNREAEGGHYELLDKYNYPYSVEVTGIPKWNSKGQIVSKPYDIYDKGIKINTTGSSTTFIAKNTNGPSSLFAPTAGGTDGQMLISGGANAAPTWTDWIKVQKITSDAYEALTTKDPNTLYAIDDEA